MITAKEWTRLLAPLNLNSIIYRDAIKSAYEEWGGNGEAIENIADVMRFALQTDEQGHCSIDRNRRPLDLMFPMWADPSVPLASLLEVFKWGRIALKSGVPASVLIGQVFHESDRGKKQDSLLGIKATAECKRKGCFKLMRTRETYSPKEVERLKTLPVPAPYLEELKAKGYTPQGWYLRTVEVMPSGKIDIACLQEFHYQPGLSDDLERFVKIYDIHFTKFHKPRWRSGWDARKFLTYVTQAEPAYATGSGYVESVMNWISKFNLEVLDKGIRII